MPRQSKVRILKQIKINDHWILAPVLFDSQGRVRRDRVRVNGSEELHPEGNYYLEWWDRGRRSREAVGADAWSAADRARHKQAELAAVRNGLIPRPTHAVEGQNRVTLHAALEVYIEHVRHHRSLRAFRTYRPILKAFESFCTKTYIDQVERQDLLDFATHCKKHGQKGKSIYNKLVVLSQVLKQYGKSKLLGSSDWPSFVGTMRPYFQVRINLGESSYFRKLECRPRAFRIGQLPLAPWTDPRR
jgi:hypothetical protein